ncbi:MAG: phosphoglucosamine mutase [Nitrospirae bacterium RIFCSPHIGHO2_02_FULL_42_12]|nr:MAG: phosphoglucosamine mutase [Nitrospirae bacterium RIFCSPHIGHO2_02_FULL_42_12]
MRRLFGTDGIRGVANIDPLTAEMTVKLGRAAAHFFKNKKNKKGHHRIIIGKDTRLSGYMFEGALTAGICSMGVDVLLVGPMPTPAIAFLTRSLRGDAGVVISASHNLFEDNGIKFFSEDGLKLPDDYEKEIEDIIFSGDIDNLRPTGSSLGKAFRIDDAEGRYIEFVKNTIPKGIDFEGIKVVVDCANGASYKITPTVLRELGAEVTTMGDNPDGVNINLGCGSLHTVKLQRAVQEYNADIGIAHDGDADRVIFADEEGNIVNGDKVMAMCAIDLKNNRRLNQDTLIATIMSNIGLEIAMKEAGIKIVRTPVGDRYVLEEMMRTNCNLGGEQSGHVIFLDYNTTGDGLITALQVLTLMKKRDRSLSELASCMKTFPQKLVSIRVNEKKDLESIPEVSHVINESEKRLDGKGRIVIRYSGTEPVLRIMVEGDREEEIEDIVDKISQTVAKHLGVN